MNEYIKGTDVICEVKFRNAERKLADPTVVIFKSEDPNNNVVTYQFGSGTEVIKDGVGMYHVNVDANLVGEWTYRFEATGTGKAADEDKFRVLPSSFP